MRIGDTLRKAASLIVDFDETEPASDFYRTTSSNSHAASPAPSAPTRPVPEPKTAPLPAPTRTVEQLVRDTPGPNLDQITAPSAPTIDVIAADGHVDFGAIYRLATLPVAPFTSEQVLELLASLPAELPIETKRATVKITLNAMTQSLGVTPDTIVADASRKLASLAAFAQSYVHQADDYVAKAESEIAAMEQEIVRRRTAIADARAKQAQVSEACHTESDRLDDVLEFFTLDVGASKYAPKS